MESEIAWFMGCIGLAGETSPVKARRVIEALGENGRLQRDDPREETRAEAFKRIFGVMQ